MYNTDLRFDCLQSPNWQRHPSFTDMETGAQRGDDVVRVVSPFDDIDGVSGNDEITAGGGDDVVYGQRGDDIMYVVTL